MRKINLLPLAGSCYGSGDATIIASGFDSLNKVAGSRDSDTRYFYARNTTHTRIMAGRDGGAFALAGSYFAGLSTLLRLASLFDSSLARLHNLKVGVATMAISAHLNLTSPEVSHA